MDDGASPSLRSAGSHPISTVIIALNEAERLEPCVRSGEPRETGPGCSRRSATVGGAEDLGHSRGRRESETTRETRCQGGTMTGGKEG